MSLATRTAHAQRRFLHLGHGYYCPPPPFLNKNFKFQIIFRNLICFTNFIDSNSTPYATLSKKSHFYSITHLSFYVSVKKKNPLQLKSNKLKKQMSYINNEQICIYQNNERWHLNNEPIEIVDCFTNL